MAESTAIEWCDATFNPWIGCTKVSPGCDNCYAARQDTFRHWTAEGWGGPRKRTSVANWKKPKAWNDRPFWECAECRQPDCGWRGEGNGESCGACGGQVVPARRRVFCASLADVFDNAVDAEWRRDLFRLIAHTQNLDWLLLTKRIGNAHEMLQDVAGSFGLSWGAHWRNVWIGATVVNQKEADRDIPRLLMTPAAKRFLSIEPMLAPICLTELQEPGELRIWIDALQGSAAALAGTGPSRKLPRIDWVIAGGESGPGARPAHPDWFRSLRDECSAAGVPYLFKQWGEWLPWTQFSDSQVDDPPEQTRFQTMEWFEDAWRDVGQPDRGASRDGYIRDMQCTGRVGKEAAGRMLDGRTHDGFPR